MRSRKFVRFPCTGLLACLVACGSAPVATPRDAGADDAALVCPGVSSTCPSGCTPLTAFAYDPVAACVAPHLGVVGCTARASPATDAGCVERTSDGALFAGSTQAFDGTDGWHACDADAGAELATAPRCPR